MVAETKESMTRVFDTVADGMRTAFDTGRKAQEAWFKTVGDACSNRPVEGERFFREWTPFFGKNMEMLAQTYDTTLRSGLGVFKAAFVASTKPGDADVYETSRQLWDSAFGAARTNFDAFGKAGAKTIENCSTLCDALLQNGTHRTNGSAPKSGKVSG